jgi:hypothetical protein
MERKTYTQEEIEEKINALPEHVRAFIYSKDMDEAVRVIGQKHQLHIDQMGFLHAEMVDLMIGKISTEEFVPYIMETVELDKQKAEAVAQDVNALVFEKIRRAMKSGAEVALTQKTITPPAPVTSTPTKEELPIPQTLPRVTPPQTPTSPPGPRNYKTDPYRESLEG